MQQDRIAQGVRIVAGNKCLASVFDQALIVMAVHRLAARTSGGKHHRAVSRHPHPLGIEQKQFGLLGRKPANDGVPHAVV